MSHLPQIVIGLGTGRCGTQSLAVILNQQEFARVEHEQHGPAIAWQGDEERVADFIRRCTTQRELALVGDVAFYYLPYVEHILELAPHAKFICMKRDRQATVKSYMTWTRRRNHWMRHDGTRWKLDRWDRCYPKYAVADKAEAVGRYWDDYYRRAAALEAAYPHAFRVFPIEAIDSTAGQEAMFDLLGLPAAARRVLLGMRVNQSPPSAPVRFLLRCAGLFRRALPRRAA
jgi:hypothetical protein